MNGLAHVAIGSFFEIINGIQQDIAERRERQAISRLFDLVNKQNEALRQQNLNVTRLTTALADAERLIEEQQALIDELTGDTGESKAKAVLPAGYVRPFSVIPGFKD